MAYTEVHRQSTCSLLGRHDLIEYFKKIRAVTGSLAAPLTDADASVQSMSETSPTKWHLAHTTWFFEAMVLAPYLRSYQPFDHRFGFLYNSYYESVGARHPRPLRGMLTRPPMETILEYRQHVDEAVLRLLDSPCPPEALELTELGCHHEQQHQELILTDILHLFFQNPLRPAYQPALQPITEPKTSAAPNFVEFEGGVIEIGHDGSSFSFDCERPRHRVIVPPFRLASRLVTNAEWQAFVDDGGYQSPILWLAEGWAAVQSGGWAQPLYWESGQDEPATMSLRGVLPIDPSAPVCHISYFEADAFARWAGKRLATEAEWECAASSVSREGNFCESGILCAAPGGESASGLQQMFGDVWEWTRSPFSPYPGFRPGPGPSAEYNGKFMVGNFVMRGGSCVTPSCHMRTTYRNFFSPATRWQFSGVRLAEDV